MFADALRNQDNVYIQVKVFFISAYLNASEWKMKFKDTVMSPSIIWWFILGSIIRSTHSTYMIK